MYVAESAHSEKIEKMRAEALENKQENQKPTEDVSDKMLIASASANLLHDEHETSADVMIDVLHYRQGKAKRDTEKDAGAEAGEKEAQHVPEEFKSNDPRHKFYTMEHLDGVPKDFIVCVLLCRETML